jgi:TolB protein
MKTLAILSIIALVSVLLCAPEVGSQTNSPSSLATGRLLYSITPPNGDNEIYIINDDGTGRTPLTDHVGRDCGPAWSPDGSRIAFYVHAVDELSWSIFVMDSTGDNIEQLTFMERVYDGSPDWSPDGTQITFSREYPEEDFRSEIWVMENNGDNLHRVDSIIGGGPEWSPDGSQFVFYSDMDGNYEIYTMDVDGENVQRLTYTDAVEWWPDWSPDGRRIAFMSDRDGDHEIYTMKADTTDLRQLTNNTADDWAPIWSPDGTEIAFESLRDGHYEIYIGVGIDDEVGGGGGLPKAFEISQNYPNPFNPSTTIEYQLLEDTKIVLKIYDIRGREVRTLVDREQTAGTKAVVWDGRDNSGRSVGSGVYIYRIRTDLPDLEQQSRKMVVVR